MLAGEDKSARPEAIDDVAEKIPAAARAVTALAALSANERGRKTYVARPAQARLRKIGQIARNTSAHQTFRSLRSALRYERAQDCGR
jgi:hypothetical protein